MFPLPAAFDAGAGFDGALKNPPPPEPPSFPDPSDVPVPPPAPPPADVIVLNDEFEPFAFGVLAASQIGDAPTPPVPPAPIVTENGYFYLHNSQEIFLYFNTTWFLRILTVLFLSNHSLKHFR